MLNKGDRVKLTADGAEYGREGSCEVVTKYVYGPDDVLFDDLRDFFMEGATGEVLDNRDGSEYLIRFDGDTVEDRAWWMCSDEIVKVVE